MPKDLKSFLADCIGLQEPWEICEADSPSESADGNIHVRIRVPPSVRLPCPGCGRMCACYDHSRERVWRSMDISAVCTYLHAEVPRTDCRTCGPLSVPVPWARPGSRFILMMEMVILALIMEMPQATAASMLHVNHKTVAAVARRHAAGIIGMMDLRNVRRVGVDERSFNGKDMVSVFVDHDTKRVIYAVPGRGSEALASFAAFLEEHGGRTHRVTDFTCDFSNAYLYGIKRHFKRARITADRFHLVKMANDALCRVKCETYGLAVTRTKVKYALMARAEDLGEERRLMLSAVMEQNPQLDEAYKLKESLCTFYSMGNRETAERHLRSWTYVASHTKLRAFKALAKTVSAHAEIILNWFGSGLTNARLEGINCLLNEVKRRVRGFRRIGNFIDIICVMAPVGA